MDPDPELNLSDWNYFQEPRDPLGQYKIRCNEYLYSSVLELFKEPWHYIFYIYFFFSSNDSAQAPDAFLNIASNSRRYLTKLVSHRCQWHRCTLDSAMQFCYKFSGVNDTALQIWQWSAFVTHIREALATFKGNIYKKNKHRQIVVHSTVCTYIFYT
jgi:hypothetical protein